MTSTILDVPFTKADPAVKHILRIGLTAQAMVGDREQVLNAGTMITQLTSGFWKTRWVDRAAADEIMDPHAQSSSGM